jgi:hypothetical protein
VEVDVSKVGWIERATVGEDDVAGREQLGGIAGILYGAEAARRQAGAQRSQQCQPTSSWGRFTDTLSCCPEPDSLGHGPAGAVHIERTSQLDYSPPPRFAGMRETARGGPYNLLRAAGTLSSSLEDRLMPRADVFRSQASFHGLPESGRFTGNSTMGGASAGILGTLKQAAERVGTVTRFGLVAVYLSLVLGFLLVTRRIDPQASLRRMLWLALKARLLGKGRGTLQGICYDTGHGYTAAVHPGLVSDADGASWLVVYEDGKPLPGSHSSHDRIRTEGRGAYSHWDGRVYFSTTDNSDPRGNGRTYTFREVPDGANSRT